MRKTINKNTICLWYDGTALDARTAQTYLAYANHRTY